MTRKERLIIQELISVIKVPYIIKQLKRTKMTYSTSTVHMFKKNREYPEDFVEFLKTDKNISVAYRNNAVATEKEVFEMKVHVYKIGVTKVCKELGYSLGTINHYLNGSSKLKYMTCMKIMYAAEGMLKNAK